MKENEGREMKNRQSPVTETVEAGDLAPYLRALQLARAETLSGQIRGERAPSAVDDAVDTLLNRFYVGGEPNRGRVIPL